ncbi:16S rRNA (cytosine(1402)-N(4))-methyltransferase [Candidatus Margulisiibacteriota bacterium]
MHQCIFHLFGKQFGKENKFKFVKLSSKVIKPTQDEIKINPRARSAKLRIFTISSKTA